MSVRIVYVQKSQTIPTKLGVEGVNQQLYEYGFRHCRVFVAEV